MNNKRSKDGKRGIFRFNLSEDYNKGQVNKRQVTHTEEQRHSKNKYERRKSKKKVVCANQKIDVRITLMTAVKHLGLNGRYNIQSCQIRWSKLIHIETGSFHQGIKQSIGRLGH